MTSNEILKADVLDILFDNRNKQYGAYTLRKNYNNRLGLALGVSLSTVLLLFILFPKNSSHGGFLDKDHGEVLVHSIDVPKPIKNEVLPPKQKTIEQPVRQRQFTRLVMVEKTTEPPPDVRIFDKTNISDITKDGAIPTGQVVIPQSSESNKTEIQETKTKQDFTAVEKEPEFPGGQEAWLNFLKKNLSSPEDLQEGEKKTVQVRFVVDKDGTVTGFQIVQSAGRSFDNEVIRVLKKMPRWRPAIQNGLAVERSYTQPVTFIGVEQ